MASFKKSLFWSNVKLLKSGKEEDDFSAVKEKLNFSKSSLCVFSPVSSLHLSNGNKRFKTLDISYSDDFRRGLGN